MLSLARSHLVTILPNAVFFSGASSASTCAIGEWEGSSLEDHPSRTRVVTSTAQMWPWVFFRRGGGEGEGKRGGGRERGGREREGERKREKGK